jgi:hypothetical protein
MQANGGVPRARSLSAWAVASSCECKKQWPIGPTGGRWKRMWHTRGCWGPSGGRAFNDRQDPRQQRHEVCTALRAVVPAGAVGVQECLFLGAAVFQQEVPRVPVGIAAQLTPFVEASLSIEHPLRTPPPDKPWARPTRTRVQRNLRPCPIGVALDEGRGPVGLRGHADARAAAGDFARKDCPATIGAVVALGGARRRSTCSVVHPPALDFRHAP